MNAEHAAKREVWRLFAAIELPDEVRARVGLIAEYLRDRAGWRAKWVAPESSHLTLKFYGYVERDRIAGMRAALRDAARSVEPFDLHTSGLGVFPNPRRPRVIWIGLGGQIERLGQLQQVVERVSADLGFEPEARPFHAHITVARIRPEDLGTVTDVERWLQRLSTEPSLPVPVEQITLFRSELRRTGPIYTVVDEFPLGRQEL